MSNLARSPTTHEILTLVAPGMVGLLAVLVATRSGYESTIRHIQEGLTASRDAQWVSSMGFLVATATIGSLIASIQGVIESAVLDRFRARRQKLTREQFDDIWYSYLKGLPENRNSYISRVVFFFQYEARIGIAGILVASAMIYRDWKPEIWMPTLTASVLIYLLCVYHHRELAEYRVDLKTRSTAL